jgi:hypothetical protein
MQIEVRIKLERLHVKRKNESADEPFLWVVFLKFDGSTANIAFPDQASILVTSPSGAHHNLGKPSEGVVSGGSLPIPAEIGEWRTELKGFDAALDLTQFATLSVAVVGLEEDQTTDSHAVELHSRVIKEVRTRLNNEIRSIIREIIEARQKGEAGPDADEVEARLREQVTAKRIKEVIDHFVGEVLPAMIAGAVLDPIAALVALVQSDQDDLIGYNVPDPFTFPRILSNSLNGIPLDLTLGNSDSENSQYRVTGRVRRVDIQEPPTLAALYRGNGRLVVFARSVGAGVFYSKSSNRGVDWGFNKRAGDGVLSSGPAAAGSSDGKRLYVFGRGKNNEMWVCLPDREGEPGGKWQRLFDRKFLSGPGAACSQDGEIIWVAGTGEDGLVYITNNLKHGSDWTNKWDPIADEKFVTSPAMACSSNGQKVHIVALGEDRQIHRAFSSDGGKTWEQRFSHRLSKTWVSAPGCATSSDGRIIWVAGLDEEHRYYIGRLSDFGKSGVGKWGPFGGTFVSAPALACSPDGKEVHIFGIAEDLSLQHRFTTDAGETWSKWAPVSHGAWY